MRMQKRSGMKQDLNERAFSIVQQIIGQEKKPDSAAEKNPNAVALGRLGGVKGGKARAAKLSPQQRSEIARAAATARWARTTQ